MSTDMSCTARKAWRNMHVKTAVICLMTAIPGHCIAMCSNYLPVSSIGTAGGL